MGGLRASRGAAWRDRARCYDGGVNLFRQSANQGELALRQDLASGDDVVIRESTRSRRLLLRVHESAQVEVVVPRGTPQRLIEQFVASHLEWIATRVARARAKARPPEAFPPTLLHLAAIGEHWQLQWVAGAGRARVREVGEERLELRGSGSPAAQRAALLRWLAARAKDVLGAWLAEVAAEHGFAYTGLQVRLQRTRWGSCSSRGRISLNLALLFQPPDVLRYLLVHELAHTRHMNHSRRFWEQVAACEPKFRQLDAQLRTGWRNVPEWLRPQRRIRP